MDRVVVVAAVVVLVVQAMVAHSSCGCSFEFGSLPLPLLLQNERGSFLFRWRPAMPYQ